MTVSDFKQAVLAKKATARNLYDVVMVSNNINVADYLQTVEVLCKNPKHPVGFPRLNLRATCSCSVGDLVIVYLKEGVFQLGMVAEELSTEEAPNMRTGYIVGKAYQASGALKDFRDYVTNKGPKLAYAKQLKEEIANKQRELSELKKELGVDNV